MKAFIVDMEFDWGFQARIIGLSKTAPSYDYPPPTTFLGAIAESLARKYWLSERTWPHFLKALTSNLLALGVRPLNCTPLTFMDINRIISIRRAGKEWYPSAQYIYKSFDAPARGKTIFSPLEYDAPRLRWFIIFKSNNIKVKDKELILDTEDFWRIHRLGSKESRVTVVKVNEVSDKVETCMKCEARTNYSFPIINGIIDPLDEFFGTWIYVTWVNPFRIAEMKVSMFKAYMERKAISAFKAPILETRFSRYSHLVKLSNWASLYYYEEDEGYEAVVGRIEEEATL